MKKKKKHLCLSRNLKFEPYSTVEKQVLKYYKRWKVASAMKSVCPEKVGSTLGKSCKTQKNSCASAGKKVVIRV